MIPLSGKGRITRRLTEEGLLVLNHPQPRRGSKRFTEKEQLAFGRFSFLSASERCFGNTEGTSCIGPPRLRLGHSKTSPTLVPLENELQGSGTASLSSQNAEEACSVLDEQMRKVLACILPVSDKPLEPSSESDSQHLPQVADSRPPSQQTTSAGPSRRRSKQTSWGPIVTSLEKVPGSETLTELHSESGPHPAHDSRPPSQQNFSRAQSRRSSKQPTSMLAPMHLERVSSAISTSENPLGGDDMEECGGGTPGKGVSERYQNEILEDLRRQLLQRFLSLHDACSRLDHGAARDRSMTVREFQLALDRLGVGETDSEEIFRLVDTNCNGGVTIAEFLHMLVDVSEEGLLWELRCRLVRSGIGAQNLWKALELVRWPQHGWMSRATGMKRRSARRERCCCACAHCADIPPDEGPVETSATSLWLPQQIVRDERIQSEIGCACPQTSTFQLPRGDWLKLCTSIYLTLSEAERLFTCLSDERGLVNLKAMFEVLRTKVEPDVSLERFSIKVLSRYKSFDECFNSFCVVTEVGSEPLLFWKGFHEIAKVVNINDGNAIKIWDVLIRTWESRRKNASLSTMDPNVGLSPPSSPAMRSDNKFFGVPKEFFVGELELWAPETQVEVLKGQLCERFGNLAECQRALEQRLSQPSSAELSAEELKMRIRQAGIRNADVDSVVKIVNERHGIVTLDTIIDTMRAARQVDTSGEVGIGHGRFGGRRPNNGTVAVTAVRTEMEPVWQQLRAVQDELNHNPTKTYKEGSFKRQSDPSLGVSRSCGALAALVSGQNPLRQQPIPSVVDKKVFTKSVHCAVIAAETRRSRFVLHNAHRQVLRLEQRWAAGSSPKLVAF